MDPSLENTALALVQHTFPCISPENWENHVQNLLCLNNTKSLWQTEEKKTIAQSSLIYLVISFFILTFFLFYTVEKKSFSTFCHVDLNELGCQTWHSSCPFQHMITLIIYKWRNNGLGEDESSLLIEEMRCCVRETSLIIVFPFNKPTIIQTPT